MFRISGLILVVALALAGCVSQEPQLAADGRPLPKLYEIRKGDEGDLFAD
jgi:hypothetical protein